MAKPRLLLDENIGITVARFLEAQDYNIFSVLREKPGASDGQILDRAVKEKRIIITLDKDFGKLVYQNNQKHSGIILLRLFDESPDNINKVLQRLLRNYGLQLLKKFTVVTETRVRVRE